MMNNLLTPEQQASILDTTVRAVMEDMVLPDLQQRVERGMETYIYNALRKMAREDFLDLIKDIVKQEISGKIKISVEIEDE